MLTPFRKYRGNPKDLIFGVDIGYKQHVIFSIADEDNNFQDEIDLKLPEVEKLVEQLSAWIGHHKA